MPVDFIEDVQKPSGAIDFTPDEPSNELSDQTIQRLQQSAQLDVSNKLYRQAQEESKLAAPGLLNLPLTALSTPLFHPKTSPEDLAFRERHPIIGGIEEGIVWLAEGLASPIGAATLGIGALPAQAQRAVAAGFAAQMASQVPEVAGQLGEEFGKPPAQRDTQKIAALITEGVGTLGMVAAAGKKGIAEPIAERAGAIPTFQVPRLLPTIQPAGETYASRVVSPEEIPQLEVRPQVGPEARVRYEGEATGAREPEPRPSPEAEVLPQPEPQKVVPEELLPPEEQAAVQAELARTQEEVPAAPPAEVLGEKPTVAEVPPEAELTESQKVQKYASEMVPSAGQYIRREIDAGNTPKEAALAWAREIGSGLMDTPDDVYRKERGGLYTSTYVKGVFGTKEGVAVNAKEYFKAIDDARNRAIQRFKKPTSEPTPAPAAEIPVAKEPWQMTRKEFGKDYRESLERPKNLSRREESGLDMRHRAAVIDAIKAGEDVPREVLADYPDLAKQAATEPEAVEGAESAVASDVPKTSVPSTETASESLRPFEVDDKLIMHSPYTRDDIVVNFRGKSGTGQAVVWTGKSQLTIPIEWLRRQGEPYVKSKQPASLSGTSLRNLQTESRPSPNVVEGAGGIPTGGLQRESVKSGLGGEVASGGVAKPQVGSPVAKAMEYKGYTVEPISATQVGYGTSERIAKGLPLRSIDFKRSRKISGWSVADSEGYTKIFDRLSDAKKWIDENPSTAVSSPAQVLSTAETLQINAPEGATYLQITQKGGGVAREPIAKLQKSNTFRGVDIAKVEAGHIGKGGKFIEDTGPLTVTPSMVGMGGAVPEEFIPSQQSPTSIKNAVVDRERIARGLTPAIQPARRSFGTVWDEAMAKIDREPDWQDRLIDELRNKPRALTDLEDAAILHRQIDLQNEYAKATRDMAQAYDDGRTADVEELKVRTAGWSDKLLDLYNIGKTVGTETGRGLAARKLMAYEDFSLAKMELNKRAANGGRQLTESEHAEITRLNEKISELQKRYDDYVARTEQQRTAPIVDQVLSDAKRVVAKSPKAATELSKLDQTTEKLGSKLKNGELDSAGGLIQKLVRALVEENPDITRDQLIDEVHGVLRDFIPEISRRETMDAISGYGDYRPLKKDTISMIVRDLKGQMQQIGKLEDMAIGKAPQKTGLERRTPTDEERRLIKLVEEAKRKGGYKITDPATQLRTALQSIKTRLENQIKDLEVQIQTRQKIVKAKTPVTLDSEASRLKARRDELKAQYDEIFPRQPMTDAQRLEAWKKRTQSRIEELQQRLASGDFEKRPMRPPPELDSQAQKLQAELFRAKQEFQRGLIEDRLKNRPWWSRSQDTFLRWYRGGILSSPVVFAKLTAAAVVRAGLTPLEEAVGAGISRVVPKLAARAPREGFWNSTAEANAITSQLTKGPKDAWDVLRTGETDLDVLYGKGREGAIGEMQVRPFSVSDIPGRSHAALKASTKRAEFERSLQKRLAYEIRNGVDASSPAVQLRAAVEAYKDANRAIFLQDNRVVSAYNRALRALEQPSKTTGQVPVGGKAIATVARTLVPIVRVPSNIVAETFQFATGSVTGSARLGRALRTGIDSLPPEQADLIMRELKKGSIGGAALIVGFLLPQVWGGFYQRGEKRQKTDIKAGEARIPGIEVPGVLSGPDVPAFLMHHPLFEAAQAGATVRRISESKWSKRMGGDQKGLPMGLMAASLGLVEETPFVREMEETVKAFNPIEQNAYFGELAKSITEPQLVQWLARQTDKDVTGETAARKPSTFLEHLKMGIPRLRRQVPLKNPVSGPNYFSMSQPTQPSPMGE